MPCFSEGRVLPEPSRADRRIANASKGHCTGFTVLGDGPGMRTVSEAWIEQCHLQLQSVRADVVDVREQVRFVYGRRDELRHFFDMVVTKGDGRRIACTIKPTIDLQSGRFVEHMRTVAWWVQEKKFAHSVRLLTEQDIDAKALHNANINVALRDRDPDAEDAARALVGNLQGRVSIKALTDNLGLGARGYRALLKLISFGDLLVPQNERITPVTLVSRKESVS